MEKARTPIEFFFPGIMLIMVLISDVFLYPIVKEQYVLFGFSLDLLAGVIVILCFNLFPLTWIFYLLYKEDDW